MIGVRLSVPAIPRDAGASVRDEFAVFRRPGLWLALLIIIVFQSGMMGVITYLSPLLTGVAGLSEGSVPTVFTALGIGSVVGTVLGGRFGDRHPWRVMIGGIAAGSVLLAAVALFAGSAPVLVVLVVLVGAASFSAAGPLNANVFTQAGAARTLAGSTITVAFNVGNAIGPWASGLAITAGAGYRSPAWIGTVLLAVSATVAVLSARYDRRRTDRSQVTVVAGGEPVAGRAEPQPGR
jgi:MFS transporter, DHA1 family, chloramphenicol resistance protein